jgi:hypothetical protein
LADSTITALGLLGSLRSQCSPWHIRHFSHKWIGSRRDGREYCRRLLHGCLHGYLRIDFALGLGGVGLLINAQFAASFGQSKAAAFLLGVIGVLVDLLVVLLPSVGPLLWRGRHHAAALAAWSIWPFLAALSIAAGIGFGADNMESTIVDRERAVHAVHGARAAVDRLRAERGTIAETRPTSVLEITLEHDRGVVDRDVWRATKGCHDVTVPSSASACANLMLTRQALALATRRDDVDAELRAAEEKLAGYQAISTADPQAKIIVEFIASLTTKKLVLDPGDLAKIRALVIGFMPLLAGVVLTLGATLWSMRRGAHD